MKRKIIENRNKILQLILFVILGAVLLAGCTDDAFEPKKGGPVDQTGVPEGYVRTRVNMVASGFDVVTTKSLTNQEEHEWSHVVVGQFDDTGKLVGAVKQYEYDGVSGYFDLILKNSGGAENLIYFITNYGEFDGDMNDPKNNPFINAEGVLVKDLDEFKAQVYAPGGVDNASITDGGQLVMVGSIKMVVDNESTPIDNILVYVDKLTAKLDVQIRASQSISSTSNPFNGASLSITGLQIVNVPIHAAFAADAGKIATPGSLSSIKAELTELGGSLVKNYGTSDSYYILENIMHPDGDRLEPNNDGEKGQEQYKNYAARDHGIEDLATYLLIEGNMNDGRNVGKVTWKIYLGENNLDNFNIKRNTHYTVTVQIDGAGIAKTDIRVNRDELVVRELRYLNGKPASNRSPETSYLGPRDKNWGNLVKPAKVDTATYLYMDAGDGEWGFNLTGQNTDLSNWSGLSVSYLPLRSGTDPGTNANMGADEIRDKWVDDVDDNWIDVGQSSATGLPSGVRVRINVGENNMPVERTVNFNYFNIKQPDQTRTWRVVQFVTDKFTILDHNFFPYKAGTYGVMIRANENSYWRLEKVLDPGLTYVDVIDIKGQSQGPVGTGAVSGHGTILFTVGEYTGVPYRRMRITVRTFDGNPNDNPSVGYSDKTININQMASASNIEKTKSGTQKYVYDYSTDPLFETMFAFNTALPMGINLIDPDTDYDIDESKYGATSSRDGKENTFKIFKALEGYVAGNIKYSDQGMTAPPVFSPAGLCMMMNDEWWDINEPNDTRLKWYLPARYQGLMDATAVMLGIKGAGYSSQASFWTSTVPRTTPASVQQSAYFAGTSVDVSATHAPTSLVRCVRDNDNVEKTYPYLANVNGNPVIVSYEKVNGVEKGFVNINPDTQGNYRYYKLGLPLRFTEAGQVSDVTGRGPSDPNWSYLSPRFRVAKQDALVSGSLVSGNWVQASGWSDANAVGLATPLTGCAAYSEEGSTTGWRLPSELEMRQILLLGGGIGSKENSQADVPVLQKGGMSFSDFTSLGFIHLGGNQANGRLYWVNRKYPNDNRSVFLRATDNWTNAISGSAVDWSSNSGFVRCVRDM